MVCVAPCSGQILYTENWDDTLGVTRWSSPLVSQQDGSLSFDGGVNYAFDYGIMSIPSAPNSPTDDTIGLFLESNKTDQTPTDEGESVGVVPNGFTLPSSNFQVQVDMYLFNNGLSGSTEYATLGAFHSGSNNVPLRFGSNAGDGLAWQIDSDGKSSSDLFRYESPGAGEVSLGEWEDIPDGSIPSVPTGNAATIGVQNQWVVLTITNLDGLIEFAANGYVIDTFDNSSNTYASGSVLLAHSDPTNSVNLDNQFGFSNGTIFDNLIVTQIIDGLEGDFNEDSIVDAADYTLWRDSLNQSVTPGTGADGSGNGLIDQADYDLWANNYGNSDTSVALIEVPEPSTMFFVGGSLLIAMARQRTF